MRATYWGAALAVACALWIAGGCASARAGAGGETGGAPGDAAQATRPDADGLPPAAAQSGQPVPAAQGGPPVPAGQGGNGMGGGSVAGAASGGAGPEAPGGPRAGGGAATYLVDPPIPAPVAAIVDARYTEVGATITRYGGRRYLVVAAGERPTGGYSVQVRGVRVQGGAWMVNARVQGPPPGAMVTQVLTYPRRAIALPDDGRAVRVVLDGKELAVTEQPAVKG